MNVKLSVPPGQEAHHPNQKAAQVKTTTHRSTVPARSAREQASGFCTSQQYKHEAQASGFHTPRSYNTVILPDDRTTRWRVVLVLRDEAQARGSFSVLVFIHGNALILVT